MLKPTRKRGARLLRRRVRVNPEVFAELEAVSRSIRLLRDAARHEALPDDIAEDLEAARHLVEGAALQLVAAQHQEVRP